MTSRVVTKTTARRRYKYKQLFWRPLDVASEEGGPARKRVGAERRTPRRRAAVIARVGAAAFGRRVCACPAAAAAAAAAVVVGSARRSRPHRRVSVSSDDEFVDLCEKLDWLAVVSVCVCVCVCVCGGDSRWSVARGLHRRPNGNNNSPTF